MKKINVTLICAEAEEYPGCADLLYSYPEVNVVGLPTRLAGGSAGRALAQTDVLVVDESVLMRDGLETVRSVHTSFPGLSILLVYEKQHKNIEMEYLAIGVRGLLERRLRISLLRRAIPALYAGEIWMPRGLVQTLRSQSTLNADSSSWESLPSMMPDRGKIN
jgi:DNA-binding NarL/FixJ family response regulator